MDYKEKYEMALETIQEILDSSSDSIKMSRLRLRLQSVFPELKESKDERIRKALISVLKSDFENDTTIHDISVGDIIAWLEKQSEQKPIYEWDEYDEMYVAALTAIVEKCDTGGELRHQLIGWLDCLKCRFERRNKQ